MNQTHIEANSASPSIVVIANGEANASNEAYDEGAFFAQTDWPWALKEDEDARPSSMADHVATAWAFISGTVCPEWNSDDVRTAFYVGYEDRATELADAGEEGFEALAEAGTVADTEGWVVQSAPWSWKGTIEEKALRPVRAAWAGAARWRALADASGKREDHWRADEARIRAEAAGGNPGGSGR